MNSLFNKIQYNDNKLYIPNELFQYYALDDIKFVVYNKFGLETFPDSFFEIAEKRFGQEEFRKKIIDRDKQCIVTNSHSNMCEACHIIPYCDCDDNNKYDVNNGILLEAGLHKLFDKYLWSINPNTNKIEVSKQLLNDNSYDLINKHHGKVLNFNNNMKNNLITHYNKFKINQK